MKEVLSQLESTDKDVSDLRKKIDIIEGNEIVSKCICSVEDEDKSLIKK